MATSKKLNVINTTPPNDLSLYSYWGNHADLAKNSGWFPAVQNPSQGYTVYRQQYQAPFNDVVIPNTNEKGRIAVIGKKGNKMDIVIENKDGNIAHVINRDVSPDFVQNYITNKQSTIQQRVNRVIPTALLASK